MYVLFFLKFIKLFEVYSFIYIKKKFELSKFELYEFELSCNRANNVIRLNKHNSFSRSTSQKKSFKQLLYKKSQTRTFYQY